MAKEWTVICKDCGKEFGYSDWSYQAGASRGQSRPERCADCRKIHNRQTALMGLAYFDLRPRTAANTSNLQPGDLGMLSHSRRDHRVCQQPSNFDPTKFGITDNDVRKLYNWFSDPTHQVAVVVGPTGSGKSTVLPYRLIAPPDDLPSDQFTRHGQVIITQPRIQATRNIPAYVAKELYGSSLGSGFDIGFRYSNHPFSDWRNRLVYITDGTLINWIVTGQIANASVIMIDEAHERSLNIDLILGLLKKLLPRYPHLKLIIASATIDSGLFVDYFGRERTALIEFQGQRKFNVETIFCPDEERLPYDDLVKLRKAIPDAVARKIIWLLERIAKGETESGDILGFLHGEKAIERAVSLVRQGVQGHEWLDGKIDVFPLYTTLSQEEQNKALLKKPDPTRRRVVITTNVAETSLTVEDIVYVVDSGLINESQWKPESETKQVVAVLHSQAGCKQRWGRAGRVRDGQAFMLYTEQQFDTLFPPFTVPQIQRSALDQIILTAKAAGIDDISTFDWIQKPPDEELKRAPVALRKIGALDAQGDLTEHGLELQAFAEEPMLANLMATADRFSCALEVATLLPMIKIGSWRYLLRWDRKWDATTRRAVGQLHNAMMQSCQDDVEFGLKLYALWSEGQSSGYPLAAEWALLQVWPRYVPQLPTDMKAALGGDTVEFRKAVEATINYNDFSEIVRRFGLASVAEHWLVDAANALKRAEQEAWCRTFFVNHSMFKNKIEPERELLLDALSGHKKDEERRLIDFSLLDKVRLIFAYCLPDRCYELVPSQGSVSESTNESSATYRWRAREQPAEVVARRTGMPVRINRDSVCYARDIHAFACAKQQVLIHRPEPHLPPVPVMHVSFLVKLKPHWLTWFEQAGSTNSLALGRFVAGETRDEATGQLHATNTTTRLFLDQLVPIGSRYECEVAQIRSDGSIVIALGRRIADPPRILESYRKGEPEEIQVMDTLEDLEGETGDLVDTVLLPEDAPVADPDEEFVPAWADLADDVRDIDGDVSGRERSFSYMHNKVEPGEFECTLAPSNTPYQNREKVVVEVEGFRFDDQNRPIALFHHVPNPEPFDSFMQQFPEAEGSTVVVRVTGYDERPGETSCSLVTREVKSGLELLLEPDQLTFTNRGAAVKEIAIGTELSVTVESVSKESRRVSLSNLPSIEAHLYEMMARQRRPDGMYDLGATVKEISSDRVFLMLEWSEPARGLVHFVGIAGRGLYKPADAYHIGELCRVRVWLPDKPLERRLPELPIEIQGVIDTHGVFRSLSWNQGTLSFTGRMSSSQRRAFVTLTRDPHYRRAIDELYWLSNQLVGQTIDTEWEPRVRAKYPIGTWVDSARVANRVAYGMFVELEPGLQGLVHTSELSNTGNVVNVGDQVRVRIATIDSEKHRISLSMRELQRDPLDTYRRGDRVRGQVTAVRNFGAFVEIVPGVSGLVHVSKMWGQVVDATRVISVGEEKEVIIEGIDHTNRKIELSMLLPELDPLRSYNPGTWVSGRVTSVQEYGAFIEIAPGVSGLLHKSQFPAFVSDARTVIVVNSMVTVRILKVDLEARRLSFSLRQF